MHSCLRQSSVPNCRDHRTAHKMWSMCSFRKKPSMGFSGLAEYEWDWVTVFSRLSTALQRVPVRNPTELFFLESRGSRKASGEVHSSCSTRRKYVLSFSVSSPLVAMRIGSHTVPLQRTVRRGIQQNATTTTGKGWYVQKFRKAARRSKTSSRTFTQ